MTPRDIETLLFVLFSDRIVSGEEIGRALAPRASRHGLYTAGYNYALPLVRQGALIKPSPDRYAITERGRVAAALLLAKSSHLRAAWIWPEAAE